MTSTGNDEWGTPPDLFEKLNSIFEFDFDACASESNHLCDNWSNDILNADLSKAGSIFCNPPYSREAGQDKIIKRLIISSNEFCLQSVVLLIPARVDTKLWQDVIFKEASFIHFVRGRIKFVAEGKSAGAPFPSAIVGINTPMDAREEIAKLIPGFPMRVSLWS
jgi:site-specific DNA-methyltransferase (adenine-specific)